MTDSNRATANEQWTSVHSYILAAICLLAGIVGGWLIRGLQIPRDTSSQPATASVPAGMPGMPASQVPTPAQMQHMADTQVAPLLEKLKSDPNNVDLLANIGNVYYDAQLFPSAIEYYQRALKIQPSNTSIRTDMATAYWYVGKADDAIAEFNKSLVRTDQAQHLVQSRHRAVARQNGHQCRDGHVEEIAGHEPELRRQRQSNGTHGASPAALGEQAGWNVL